MKNTWNPKASEDNKVEKRKSNRDAAAAAIAKYNHVDDDDKGNESEGTKMICDDLLETNTVANKRAR